MADDRWRGGYPQRGRPGTGSQPDGYGCGGNDRCVMAPPPRTHVRGRNGSEESHHPVDAHCGKKVRIAVYSGVRIGKPLECGLPPGEGESGCRRGAVRNGPRRSVPGWRRCTSRTRSATSRRPGVGGPARSGYPSPRFPHLPPASAPRPADVPTPGPPRG